MMCWIVVLKIPDDDVLVKMVATARGSECNASLIVLSKDKAVVCFNDKENYRRFREWMEDQRDAVTAAIIYLGPKADCLEVFPEIFPRGGTYA